MKDYWAGPWKLGNKTHSRKNAFRFILQETTIQDPVPRKPINQVLIWCLSGREALAKRLQPTNQPRNDHFSNFESNPMWFFVPFFFVPLPFTFKCSLVISSLRSGWTRNPFARDAKTPLYIFNINELFFRFLCRVLNFICLVPFYPLPPKQKLYGFMALA